MSQITRVRRGLAVTIGGAALALACTLGAAAPATAAVPAGVASSALVVTAELAPTCVDVVKTGTSWGFPYATIKNNCRTTQRVKIIWANAPDSACKQLAPGKTYKHSTGVFGRFDGIKKC